MELIVADANIFVYLFRCKLLNIFLSNETYNIKITSEVFDEITASRRRISREHPEMSKIILDAIHNEKSSEELEVIDINEEIYNQDAIGVYYRLNDEEARDGEGRLDKGEI